MNFQAFTIQLIVFGLVFLSIQRADPTKKNAIRYFALFILLLLVVYTWWYSAWQSVIFAALIALIVNFLFWLFIGRYNPPSSSDNIRVMGMDD